MSNVYVLNENGVYFMIDQFVDTSTNLLIDKGCKVFDNIDSLYDAVQDENGLERDEVEGNELRIFERNGDTFCYDQVRDHEEEIGGPVEFFVSEYVV